MRHCRKNEMMKEGVSVAVQVDVTKIVRYSCTAAVLIVGIIFGTKCYRELMKEQ